MGVSERRQRERAARREAILDAAEQVFARSGPIAATMDEIAAEAELSKGTLYLYFKHKDELYLGLAARSLEALVERFSALPPQPTGHAQISLMCRTQDEFSQDYPHRLRSMLAWLASGFHADRDSPTFDPYRHLVLRMAGLVVEALERGQRDGSVRTDVSPGLTLLQLWGGFVGMSMLLANREEIASRMPMADAATFDLLLPRFYDTVLREIAAPRRASP